MFHDVPFRFVVIFSSHGVLDGFLVNIRLGETIHIPES